MNGVSTAVMNGAHGPRADENHSMSRVASPPNSARSRTAQRPAAAVRKGPGESTTRRIVKKPTTTKSKKNGAQQRHDQDNSPYLPESDEDIPENMYRPDNEEYEGWVHRDKLAKIESEELQAAGINLAAQRSRNQRAPQDQPEVAKSPEPEPEPEIRPEPEHEEEPASEAKPEPEREEKGQRLQSPIQSVGEEEALVEQPDRDMQSPEEVASEQGASSLYSIPALKKSGSKIPVMSSSPMPIPGERYGRETPVTRKRTASGTISMDSEVAVSKTRSMSSNARDEVEDPPANDGSKPDSPDKSKSKSPTTPVATTVRKTPSTVKKSSIPSAKNPASPTRPVTRGGEGDRPRVTINPPEGDPPWLATMYKPDPKLPPDQQIIPTLARKQQQAEWAQSGAVPVTYDREFSPLAVHDEASLVKAQSPSPTPSGKGEIEDLKAADEPIAKPGLKTVRPGTSNSVTTSYSTMPKVTNPAGRSTSPKTGTGPTPTTAQGKTTQPMPPSKVQQMPIEQDEKVKKGCGACCIVM